MESTSIRNVFKKYYKLDTFFDRVFCVFLNNYQAKLRGKNICFWSKINEAKMCRSSIHTVNTMLLWGSAMSNMSKISWKIVEKHSRKWFPKRHNFLFDFDVKKRPKNDKKTSKLSQEWDAKNATTKTRPFWIDFELMLGCFFGIAVLLDVFADS